MHIKKVKNVNVVTNISLFMAVGATNVLRTTVLMISNLISAVLILIQETQVVIMITWPIINFLFILLVGYDTDIARLLRKIHRSSRNQRQDSSQTELAPSPGSGHEYNCDKISSLQSEQNSSNLNNDSAYQLQPTLSPHALHSPPITDEERGSWHVPWENSTVKPCEV
jgi:hypothetical protein